MTRLKRIVVDNNVLISCLFLPALVSARVRRAVDTLNRDGMLTAVHSYLSATMGSTFVARRAGT